MLIATPLATGFTIFAPTAYGYTTSSQSALPGGTVTAPADGAVITSGSQATARASFKDMLLGVELRVDSPDTGERVLASGQWTGNISGSFSIRQNGKYTVRLVGKTGTRYDTNTFYVRVPPAQPSGLSASVSGSTLSVTWNLGLEDDLTGYSVQAGGVGSKSGSPGALCSGTICSAKFSLGSGDTGSTTVSVRAQRPNGTGGSVSSSAATDSVQLGGSGSGGGGGDGDSDSGGGGGNGGNDNLPSPDYNGGGGGGTPLTPFNEESPVTLPSVQPDGAAPGFAYPAPVVAGENAGDQPAAISNLQWGKSVALALVLLIIAAHLGTWTRRMRVAQAGVSAKGMAARAARGGSGRTRVQRAQEHIARAQATAKTSMSGKARRAAKSAPPVAGGKGRAPYSGKKGGTAARSGAQAPGARDGRDEKSIVGVRTVQPGAARQNTAAQRESVAGYQIVAPGPETSAPSTSGAPSNTASRPTDPMAAPPPGPAQDPATPATATDAHRQAQSQAAQRPEGRGRHSRRDR
ncbi:hypothetical protein [Thermomonospora echinospora]|uniref:hypothetical protein n=1 Tax=Thermomonospora echinospora TaxID=1992 RepID=UPI000CDE71B9|nr:hypothetical protein [Thermomonospora echinospora]